MPSIENAKEHENADAEASTASGNTAGPVSLIEAGATSKDVAPARQARPGAGTMCALVLMHLESACLRLRRPQTKGPTAKHPRAPASQSPMPALHLVETAFPRMDSSDAIPVMAAASRNSWEPRVPTLTCPKSSARPIVVPSCGVGAHGARRSVCGALIPCGNSTLITLSSGLNWTSRSSRGLRARSMRNMRTASLSRALVVACLDLLREALQELT
jgi:hypothetical protein